MSVSSYSFYQRSSSTGYSQYTVSINGTQVGSGNIFVDVAGQTNPVQPTGDQALTTAMNNLTGHVTVVITLSSGTHGAQGTFRMDNFTLNGYTVPTSYSSPAPNLYIHKGNYRYGFNGKENDNEVKGEGNQQDYGMRIYDPRIGRWLSTDIMTEKYPYLSPYNYVANNPTIFIDADGKDLILVSGDAAAWAIFKSIIEDNFGGIIKVDKTQLIRTFARYPQLNPSVKYEKVNLTINDEKLLELAKQQVGKDATVEAISKKKQEIAEEVINSNGFKLLNEIVSGSKDGVYSITDNGLSFGSASAGPNFPQGISLNNIKLFNGIGLLTAFNQMLHEIREGFYIENAAQRGNVDFKDTKPYAYAHWTALEDQAKALGVDFLYSDIQPIDFGVPGTSNGYLIVTTYKKIKEKNREVYQKTVYKIRMKDNNVDLNPTDGTQGVIVENTKLISKAQYENEKSKAKEVLKSSQQKD